MYVFQRSGTSWSQIAYIKAVNGENGDGDMGSLALDNSTIVVGSQSEDSNQRGITNGNTASTDNSNPGSGAVYVYRAY